MVFWVEILGSRSTLPGQFSHDTRRRPPSPQTVFLLPPAAPSLERLLHSLGIFLAHVDHVSSFCLSPPRLAAFFGGSSVSHWREAYLWPRVALTRHQRWLPLPSPPGLCCWLFSCFFVVVFCFGFLCCTFSLFIIVSVFEFFGLFIHLIPP
jgi:hypothetical protein